MFDCKPLGTLIGALFERTSAVKGQACRINENLNANRSRSYPRTLPRVSGIEISLNASCDRASPW
jgi:hypothetical protein